MGIVGTGFAGAFHADCLRRVHGVELRIAGVTSLREERREAFGRAHGIPVFDGVEALLEAVDLLDLCSPPSVHEQDLWRAIEAGKGVICEKPLTGYFGPPGEDAFRGDRAPKEPMLASVVERLERLDEGLSRTGAWFGYAENFVYAPSVQKEREILEKTGAQILRMTAEESHSGSASPGYGLWSQSGGGSLIGKGVHPLGAMLYLKRVEGWARNGRPIRPAAVSARTHALTRRPSYRDAGFLRTEYLDVEDYGMVHVVFEDGMVGDLFASEVALGGIYNHVEVFANNHRTRCRLSPAGLMDTYNPRGDQYRGIYLVEKASTQEGWSPAAPDENFTLGYQAEMQDLIECAARGAVPRSDWALAVDTTLATYAAYVSAERRGREVEVPRLSPRAGGGKEGPG